MISASDFFSVSSFFIASAIDLPLHLLPERLHLPRFELGLGDDVAVHLHEHLLDHCLGAGRSASAIGAAGRATRIAAARSCFFIIFSILAYPDAFAQIAQQAGDPAEHAPLGPGVFRRRPEDLVPAEAACDLAGRRPGRPPRPSGPCSAAPGAGAPRAPSYQA